MRKIARSYRLSAEVLEMVQNRDKERYPYDNLYIEEAIRNFESRGEKSNNRSKEYQEEVVSLLTEIVTILKANPEEERFDLDESDFL